MTRSVDYHALTPVEVSNYLRSSGWQRLETFGRAAVWGLTRESDEFEALVPLEAGLRDYSVRMTDLLRTLAVAEQRTEQEIVRDLTTAHVDTQYFRTHPDTPPGTIPVTDGIDALEGIRELMIAAAYSLVADPRLVLPPRKPRQVEDFPRQVRLGPSVAGSYVLSAEVPLGAEERAQESLFDQPLPFGRRAIMRLHGMIQATRLAAEEAIEGSELSPFTDRVGEGVSTTLCRALARFGGHDRDRRFEVRFSWASAMPLPVGTAPIDFEADTVTMLAQAAEDLTEEHRLIRERAVVTGRVWRTERAGDERWIVVRGAAQIGERVRHRYVWVRLDADQFTQALRAHDSGWRVRLAGVLVRSNNRTELEELTEFRTVDG